MSITLRPLTVVERERAFAKKAARDKLAPYIETVQEMEGGVAYAIALNGSTARSVRVMMGRAANQLDLPLRWAKVPKDAKELIVELAGGEGGA